MQMKKIIAMALAGGVGAVLGASGMSALHAATAKPPAFLVANITDVTNLPMLKQYQAVAPCINKVFGGRVLARGKATTVDPRSPAPGGTMVMLQFPDMKHLMDWYTSPAYAKIKGLRENSSKTYEYAVEGLPPS